MAKMSFSSYILILTFSLLSQGVLLSASKSISNLEDDMVFKALRLGKAFQKEDTAEKSVVVPSLEQYKNDESSFMNDEENKDSKCSGVCWEESIDLVGKSDDTCWSTSPFQKKKKII
ncbi:Pro-MCH [Camelus dromedarius]|uniref:Pro-MCH n=1 Tax=Camelus dromedarius TaxID=9838 RepID=A0A5N4DFZ0_CAMDR|nr:Pro-MCH [Camelus dromedarius]